VASRRGGWDWLRLALTLVAIGVVTLLGPTERTLGSNLRLVVLHGGWVWTGKIAFASAALTGLLGLVLPKGLWPALSRSLGLTGLLLWLTYLPMSLLVQMQNWGGIFWDEPRWRIPFTFGVVGLLMQAGLWVMNHKTLTCAANLVFGIVLWQQLGGISNILHPDSPIFGSDSTAIQVFFILTLVLILLAAAQIAWLIYRRLSLNVSIGRAV
jgi:hypothetical protein